MSNRIDFQTLLGDIYEQLKVEDVYPNEVHDWKKKGSKYGGCCPFHESKGSSFFVDSQSLFWCCTGGCGLQGYPIQYLSQRRYGHMQPRGKDFIDLVKELAELARVDLPDDLTKVDGDFSHKLLRRSEAIAAVHEKTRQILKGRSGQEARQYLLGRGFTGADIEQIGFGLYPQAAKMTSKLRDEGFDIDGLRGYGLLSTMWQGYIVMPCKDHRGRLLSLHGRWPGSPPLMKDHPGWKFVRDDQLRRWQKARKSEPFEEPSLPKMYSLKNPKSETDEVFNLKQYPLYLYRVIECRVRELTLVEGFYDAAICQVRGDVSVAAVGSAKISREQIEVIRRSRFDSVTVVFDGDEAGQNGTFSAVADLAAAGQRPYVVTLDDGIDPDEVVNSKGIDEWLRLKSGRRHGYRFVAERLIDECSSGNGAWPDEAVAKLADRIWKFTKKIPDGQAKDDLTAFFWPLISAVVKMPVYDLLALMEIAAETPDGQEPSEAQKNKIDARQLQAQLDAVIREHDGIRRSLRTIKIRDKTQMSMLDIEKMVSERISAIEWDAQRSITTKTLLRSIERKVARTQLECYLPPVLAKALNGKADSMGVDPMAMLLPLLSTVGSLVGGKAVIQLRRRSEWTEQCSIWTMLIAKSGSGKSPILNTVTRPLEAIQWKLDKEFDEKSRAFELQMELWSALKPEEKRNQPKPERPHSERLIMNEATFEAMMMRMATQSQGAGLLWSNDEFAALIKGLDQHKAGGKGNSLETLLKLWSDTNHRVDRVQIEKSFVIRGVTLSVTGGLQPQIYDEVLGDPDDPKGLQARFLAYRPLPQKAEIVDRMFDVSPMLQSMYETLYKHSTFDVTKPRAGTFADFQPAHIRLSADALERFESYEKESRISSQYAGIESLAAFLSKAPAHVARVALGLHCIQIGLGLVVGDARWAVTGETMRQATDLVQFLGSQMFAERFDQTQPELIDCNRVIEFAVKAGGIVTDQQLVQRKIVRAGSQTMKHSQYAREIMTRLAEIGFGDIEPTGRLSIKLDMSKSVLFKQFMGIDPETEQFMSGLTDGERFDRLTDVAKQDLGLRPTIEDGKLVDPPIRFEIGSNPYSNLWASIEVNDVDDANLEYVFTNAFSRGLPPPDSWLSDDLKSGFEYKVDRETGMPIIDGSITAQRFLVSAGVKTKLTGRAAMQHKVAQDVNWTVEAVFRKEDLMMARLSSDEFEDVLEAKLDDLLPSVEYRLLDPA